MVKLNKIYTKTGDDGTTGLVRGPRRSKADIRLHAVGGVDEANAAVGQVRLHAASMPKIDSLLARVQNDLFDVGSDLATPGEDKAGDHPSLRVTERQTRYLEDTIDTYNESLAPLTSFVLPGGTPLAVAMHIARTIIRRAERDTVALLEAEPETSLEALRYLNRLSDLMFVLARVANGNGSKDVLWQPGRHTGSTS